MLAFVFYFTELIIAGFVQKTHIIVFFAFGLNFIRELIKDICDIKGDKSISMKTLPIVLGKKKTLLFVQILIFGFIISTTSHILFYYSSTKLMIWIISKILTITSEFISASDF